MDFQGWIPSQTTLTWIVLDVQQLDHFDASKFGLHLTKEYVLLEIGKVFNQIGKNDKWRLYAKCYQKTAKRGIIKVQSLPEVYGTSLGKALELLWYSPILTF